jgi:hypothetical protein
MLTIMQTISFWLIVLILHEAGHYYACVFFGHRPKISMKWWVLRYRVRCSTGWR